MTAPDQCVPGPLEVLVNHVLTHIALDVENAERGTHLAPAYNLESSANEALSNALDALAPDVAEGVTKTFGFELGLGIAAIVQRDPLGDNRPAIRALLELAIVDQRYIERAPSAGVMNEPEAHEGRRGQRT